MSTAQNEIARLIGHWKTRKAFAEAVGADVDAVHKWAQNGRIPAGWHHAAVTAARTAGVEYATPEWIVRVHAVTSEPAPSQGAS